MQELLIITPVKDSIDHTIRTMEAVVQSELTVPHRYVVYNDNSTPENTARLHAEGQRLGVEVVDLADLTDHPLAQLPLCAAPLSERSLGHRRGTAELWRCDVTVQRDTLQNSMKATDGAHGLWHRRRGDRGRGGKNQLPLSLRSRQRGEGLRLQETLFLLLFAAHARTAKSL